MERKKPGRKAEPASKRRIAWPSWTGFSGMTLRNWLELLGTLAIPVVVAVATAWFSSQQNTTQTQIEEQRAQDEALQAYFDQMGTLLLERDLRSSTEDNATQESEEARTLARARTLTVLGRLGSSRKTQVLQFLIEANLIRSVNGKDPIVALSGAALPNVFLDGADLHGADLSDADLYSADLSDADLSDADLSPFTSLSEANLFEANLSEANLRTSFLSRADLGFADLSGANLYNADLSDADLGHADLSGADLSYADLRGADLSDANLRLANLRYADLSDADLSNVDLSGAYLHLAEVSEEQLDQANSLAGAIKPDSPPFDTVVSARYATRDFEPALSLRLGDGWHLGWEYGEEIGSPETPETPDMLNIGGPEEGIRLQFFSPVQVFAASKPSERIEVSAPDNVDEWISWFQEHPNLDITSQRVPRSVGGESGKQIDVTPTPEPSSAINCGKTAALRTGATPCVHLFPIGGSVRIASYERTKDRFIIVDNVEDETVVIRISAPAEKFDEVLPKARNVLDTVEWEGG